MGMSTVDISYGMGSYRAFGGGSRTERRTGEKTGETGKSESGKSPEARKETEKSGAGAFAKSMADIAEDKTGEKTAVTGEEAMEKGKASAAGRKAMEKGKVSAAGREAVEDPEVQKASSVWEEGLTGQETKSPQDMSLDEYMQYIYGIISELSRKNYSRGNSVFIYISEEGFLAMQNDPEYEAWVMENIRQAYHDCGSRGGHDGYHSAHFFGATKEEYQGQSWHSGCSKCEQERRRERRLRQKKRLEALLKKRRERKLLEQQRLAKLRLEKAFYKKLLAKKRLDRERLEESYREEAFVRKKLEEGHREEALARREAASAFRMYQAIAKYNEQ